MKITPQTEIKIAAEAGLSIDTVRRYLAGCKTHSTTTDRMLRALEVLKIRIELPVRKETER